MRVRSGSLRLNGCELGGCRYKSPTTTNNRTKTSLLDTTTAPKVAGPFVPPTRMTIRTQVMDRDGHSRYTPRAHRRDGGQLHRSKHAPEPPFAGLFTQQLAERFRREELTSHGRIITYKPSRPGLQTRLERRVRPPSRQRRFGESRQSSRHRRRAEAEGPA